jgi:hypothetical protein
MLLMRHPKPCYRIFGQKRNEVTGGWIKLHNEELHNFYSSPSIIRMINSRMMRWAGHLAQFSDTCCLHVWVPWKLALIYQTIRRHIPDNGNLQSLCENLKFHSLNIIEPKYTMDTIISCSNKPKTKLN